MPDQTGPTTPAGKAIAARNSLRHGLSAQEIVLPDEVQEDWAAFASATADALEPLGTLEEAFAHRIAEILWRLRRVARAEHDAVYDRLERPTEYEAVRRKPSMLDPWRAAAEPPENLPLTLPAPTALRPIMRYEAHLNRQLTQTLHELQALQDRRSGRHAPLARLDVSLSSADVDE